MFLFASKTSSCQYVMVDTVTKAWVNNQIVGSCYCILYIIDNILQNTTIYFNITIIFIQYMPLVLCISDISYTNILYMHSHRKAHDISSHWQTVLPSSCTWEISAQHVLSRWLGRQPPRHSPLWPDMKTPFDSPTEENKSIYKAYMCQIYVSLNRNHIYSSTLYRA